MEKSAVIEISQICSLMTAHRFEELYTKGRVGIIATTNLFAEWSYEFYEKYKEFDWESLLETEQVQTEFPKHCICWDDCIFYYVENKVEQYLRK